MDGAPTATGTCVVRLEWRGTAGVLVTLRGSLDIADPECEWVVRTDDVDHARDLVCRFFTDFLARG